MTEAKITSNHRLSSIWIVPILALIIGLWMLFQYINNQGPEITLKLTNAAGIEAGKTKIKSHNVDVGMVTGVELSENYDYIIATAQIDKKNRRMLKEDSRFWVVQPRVSAEGVSGLETLLSGSYIELQAGVEAKEKLNFEALATPPITDRDTKGTRIVLTHEIAGKLTPGDPVLYHGFSVGKVEKATFDVAKQKALYQLFIFSPYDDLVFERTNFWLKSAIDIQLNANGLDVEIGSLQTLLSGGVMFDVPKDIPQGKAINQLTTNSTELPRFRLFDDVEQIEDERYKNYLEYVMLFTDSIRGLKVNAPVEFRGLQIGTVKEVPLKLPLHDFKNLAHRIPVLIHIEFDRMGNVIENIKLEEMQSKFEEQLHQNNLKATLKAGNILTGALYIDLDINTTSEKQETTAVEEFNGYTVIPTQSGGLAEIQKQMVSFLNKLNDLPLKEATSSLNKTLKASDRTFTSASKTMEELNEMLNNKQTKAIPKELQNTLKELKEMLQGYGPNSKLYRNMEGTMQELEGALRDIQPVLKQLNDKPNSLIFESEPTPDPIPMKGATK